MEIPHNLLRSIELGQAVLVLGAGASMGALSPSGKPAPTSLELARAIAKRFLGDQFSDRPLSSVAELAISESDLFTVQEFIRSLFQDLEPASFHKLLPTFKWAGLATTNFDLIVQRAYQGSQQPAQQLVPFIKNGDRIEEKLKSPRSLMFLKLHGCITRTSDPLIPLILTVDQYVTHRSGRDRVFDHLKTLSFGHPLIFVGHSLEDPDIRQFLLELGSHGERPRYFTVTPTITGPEKRLLEGKRISPLEGTFQEFLSTIDGELSSVFRGVTAASVVPELPIAERFIVRNPGLSQSSFEFLENDVEYVRNGMAIDSLADPRLFYRGFSPTWSAVDANLDVRRDVENTIVADAILEEASDVRPRFYAIKGHAGSGKSVLLQRVAWEAAITYGKLCLYLRPHGAISFESLAELAKIVDERIYLFVDDAADHVPQTLLLLEKAARSSIPLTVFVAERINQWNMACPDLAPYLEDEFEVRYLSAKEIDGLLALLERNQALFRLEQFSEEERRAEFLDRAGRQLLVALHEATLGKPFEDIIADEYAEIRPDTAKSIYLGVCFLNRYNVSVRAGIVSRVYGVGFTEFKQKFFQPLESLVFSRYDQRTRDYVYETRHPHIAEIVVERALTDVAANLRMHRQMLAAMNIDYDSDRSAFRRLLSGRSLLQAFPDHQMAELLYRTARGRFGDEPYLLHQEAIYEMQRPNGNLTRAAGLLVQARSKLPYDRTLIHSLAELQIRMSEDGGTALQIESHLREAEKLVGPLATSRAVDSYGFHTLAKVQLERLRLFLQNSQDPGTGLLLDDRIRAVEAVMQEGLQQFPDDPYLLNIESRLGELLADDARAVAALRTAFAKIPDSAFIAIRLAKLFAKAGNDKEAIAVYRAAMEAGVNDKQVHFNYARALMEQPNSDEHDVEYHLRRGFTEGDSNLEAQFWFARQLYVNGDIEAARIRFEGLKRLSMNPQTKRRVRGVMCDGQGQLRFTGGVDRVEYDYGFVHRDGTGDRIFFHRKNIDDSVGEALAWRSRVSFSIGFNFWGPTAVDLTPDY